LVFDVNFYPKSILLKLVEFS